MVMSGIAAYDHSQWLFRSGPGLPWPSLVGGGTRAGLAETSGLFGAVEPGVVSVRFRELVLLSAPAIGASLDTALVCRRVGSPGEVAPPAGGAVGGCHGIGARAGRRCVECGVASFESDESPELARSRPVKPAATCACSGVGGRGAAGTSRR